MKISESPHGRMYKKLEERRSEYRYKTFNLIDSVESSRFIIKNIEEKAPLSFSSNVFLNLSNHKLQKERIIKFTQKVGAICSSSTDMAIYTLINYYNGLINSTVPSPSILGSEHQEMGCKKFIEFQ